MEMNCGDHTWVPQRFHPGWECSRCGALTYKERIAMGESKHTEGPWGVEDLFEVFCHLRGSPKRIAKVGTVRLTNEEAEANARLIAAAPELLEAAQFAFKALHRVPETAKDTLRAAIAKATGKES